MRRMISEKAQKYIKDLATNHPDPSAEWGGSGVEYTAGDGINITEGEISVNYGTGLTVDDETLIIDTSTIATKSELFSGDYDDLTNKPTIPTDTSDLTNGAGFITGITSTDVTTALGYTPGTSNFSGDYTDLTNKPTIPAAVSGTNDGTNWTNLTIGSDTYAIPAGGGSSYTFTNGLAESSGTVSIDLANSPYIFNGQYNKNAIGIYNNQGLVLNTSNNFYRVKYGISMVDPDLNNTLMLGYGSGQANDSDPFCGSGSGNYFAVKIWPGLNGSVSGANYEIQGIKYLGSSQRHPFVINNSHIIYNKLSSSSPYTSKVFEVSDTTLDYNDGKMTVDTNGNMTLAGSITATNTVQLTFTYSDNTTETVTLIGTTSASS